MEDVHYIVKFASEIMYILAIERRDEGAIKLIVNLMGGDVRLVLDVLKRVKGFGLVVPFLGQGLEDFGGLTLWAACASNSSKNFSSFGRKLNAMGPPEFRFAANFKLL